MKVLPFCSCLTKDVKHMSVTEATADGLCLYCKHFVFYRKVDDDYSEELYIRPNKYTSTKKEMVKVTDRESGDIVGYYDSYTDFCNLYSYNYSTVVSNIKSKGFYKDFIIEKIVRDETVLI